MQIETIVDEWKWSRFWDKKFLHISLGRSRLFRRSMRAHIYELIFINIGVGGISIVIVFYL